MRVYLFFFSMVLSAFAASAQTIKLNLYGNYVFDDKVESYYSTSNYFHGTIQGGFLWGGSVEFAMHDTYGLELLYLRQNTTAPVHYYDVYSLSERNADLGLNINWIMAGGIRSTKLSDKVEPFGGLLLGVAIIDGHNEESGNSGSATKFAWGLKAGINYWANERFGIKFQAQLLSAVQAAGGNVYFFGSGGNGGSVTAYSTMFQFALGGGLVFKFPR